MEKLIAQYREATGSKATEKSLRKMGRAKLEKALTASRVEAKIPSNRLRQLRGESAKSDGLRLPPPKPKVGAFARQLIRGNDAPYKELLAIIQANYPHAKTTTRCLAWYANDLRKGGIEVPPRRRN